MDVEGDVLEHVEAVCHGDAGEDHVDGVGPHVLVGEHEDVCRVEQAAQDAHVQGQVAVHGQVQILQIMMHCTRSSNPCTQMCILII